MVLDRITDQIVVGLDQARQRTEDVVRRFRTAKVLRNNPARIVPGREPAVGAVHDVDQTLESVRIGLDLARRIIVLDHEHTDVLVGMRRVVLIELRLGEQQHVA